MRSSSLTCKLRAKRLSNLQRGIIFSRVRQNMFPLGFPERKLSGQWRQGYYWPVARVCKVPVRDTLIGETHWPVATNCGFKLYIIVSDTHSEQRQPPRSVTEGLGTSGGEEYKCFLPPGVPKANSASPRVVLGSLISNTPPATPRRRTLTEDLAPAGAIGRRRQ